MAGLSRSYPISNLQLAPTLAERAAGPFDSKLALIERQAELHTSFFGASGNAARIQIAVALIAFLLLRMAYGLQHNVQSLLAFTRLVTNKFMHRRPIHRLLDAPPPTLRDQRQLSLSLR
jgi:hypothetical protein